MLLGEPKILLFVGGAAAGAATPPPNPVLFVACAPPKIEVVAVAWPPAPNTEPPPKMLPPVAVEGDPPPNIDPPEAAVPATVPAVDAGDPNIDPVLLPNNDPPPTPNPAVVGAVAAAAPPPPNGDTVDAGAPKGEAVVAIGAADPNPMLPKENAEAALALDAAGEGSEIVAVFCACPKTD